MNIVIRFCRSDSKKTSLRATAYFLGIVLSCGAVMTPLQAEENLTILRKTPDGKLPHRLLYTVLQQQAHRLLDRRDAEVEKLATASPEDIHARQKKLRTFFIRQLGGFPERAPLNAKIVGRVKGDGYLIEKVLFESQPGHHVTALVYLPTKTQPPWPGVVIACGHSRTGKAADYNQRFGIIMAKHGMAAICYDPIGQGERSQILDEQGHNKHRGTTTEHFLVGAGSILVGRNTARYRIWDGMRTIDYFTSRKDIDGKRIGFTGCSGGGTLTSYVMALDDRVWCAAPACYLTTFRRLIDTIGPQDAEQNIFGQLAFGMDQPDYIFMRAPKPTLISATTEDFFPISGTWENYRQNKRIYLRLGFSERLDLVEGPGRHGVRMDNLNAIARWMSRWLLNREQHIAETDLSVHPLEQLQCTPKGQVLLLPGEKSIFDLNTEYERVLAKRRELLRQKVSADQQRAKVRQLAGIRPLGKLPAVTVIRPEGNSTLRRNGYRIEKRVLQRAGAVPLPGLLFVPDRISGKPVLYLSGTGKSTVALPGGEVEKLVRAGHVVLAVDLSGLGETRPKGYDGLLGNWKDFFLAYLLGKSLVGIRAEDVLAASQVLARASANVGGNTSASAGAAVELIATGEAAIPALHAAAAEPKLFSSVRLSGMIRSWREVVRASETNNQIVGTVHGALKFYDLPDLIDLAGRNKVTLQNPVDAMGRPVSASR